MKCRNCRHSIGEAIIDLGMAPHSNECLDPEENKANQKYPLKLHLCAKCGLLQTDDQLPRDVLFSRDYPYFSSVSVSWVAHAKNFAVQQINDLGLNSNSLVVELASNDGYLLQHFVDRGIPCLGVEPTNSTAQEARNKGIKVIEEFFGEALASEIASSNGLADLVVANNVLAHVPDVSDFVSGIKKLLAPNGVVSLEFPHLKCLLEEFQFDTIYHEHFSYFSLKVVLDIFSKVGLKVFHVETLNTHGGSLRVFATHMDASCSISGSVKNIISTEDQAGLSSASTYDEFNNAIKDIADNFKAFLILAKQQKKKVYGYGAAAKASTIINFCNLDKDLLPAIADKAESKQGKLIPGTDIPIISPEALIQRSPDHLIVFPWNISEEIRLSLAQQFDRSPRFHKCIPFFQELI